MTTRTPPDKDRRIKVTPEILKKMKEEYESGDYSLQEIADNHGISRATVYKKLFYGA